MIGIFTYKAKSAEMTKIWVEKFLPNYAKSIYSPADLTGCNLLILPGGKDLGQDTERDTMEINVLDTAIKLNIPVIGICRGMQLINHYFGGTLHENIKDHRDKSPEGKNIEVFHEIFDSLTGTNMFVSNSKHHQSIDKIGNGCFVEMKSADGTIEAISFSNGCGFQWHPEYETAYNEKYELYVRMLIFNVITAELNTKLLNGII